MGVSVPSLARVSQPVFRPSQQLGRGLRHGQAQGGQNILSQRFAWVRRIMHSAHRRILLVTIVVIDEYSILPIEFKGQSPIPAHRHRIPPLDKEMEAL